MLNNQTLDKLRALKLTGMADALTEQFNSPASDMSFEERLAILIEREWITRENKRLARRLSQAKLKDNACIEDIDFDHRRKLKKNVVADLSSCNWIKNKLNLLITGPTGCGKTYLACALAHKACLSGMTSKYYRLPRLWNELLIAKANGTYQKWLNQLAKIDVLIFDDWGLAAPNEQQRHDLLEILEDRYQNRSTIVTSQLPVASWYQHLNDETLADAILDRLVHNAIKMELDGESLRKKDKSLQAAKA